MKLIIDEYAVTNSVKTSLQCMLFTTWDKAPISLKIDVLKEYWQFCDDLLYHTQDVAFMMYIINDPAVPSLRSEALGSDDKCCIRLFTDLRYDAVDKIMKYIVQTDEERIEFKKKMDQSDICRFFLVACRYDNATRYVNWRFDTEEEKVEFKSAAKLDNMATSIIISDWLLGHSPYFCKENILGLLEWLKYDKDDMQILVRQWLDNPHFKEHFERSGGEEWRQVFDEFLTSCQFSEELHDILQRARSAKRRRIEE